MRRVWESLGQMSRDAAFDEPVQFDLLIAHLARAFEQADYGAGFLVGRVTFWRSSPMREPVKIASWE